MEARHLRLMELWGLEPEDVVDITGQSEGYNLVDTCNRRGTWQPA